MCHTKIFMALFLMKYWHAQDSVVTQIAYCKTHKYKCHFKVLLHFYLFKSSTLFVKNYSKGMLIKSVISLTMHTECCLEMTLLNFRHSTTRNIRFPDSMCNSLWNNVSLDCCISHISRPTVKKGIRLET